MANPLRPRPSSFTRRLNPRDYANGEAFLNAMIGGSGTTFAQSMEIDQQLALAEDAQDVIRTYGAPDRWAYVEVNKLRAKGLPYEQTVSYVSQMDLGSRANFFAEEQDRDITKVVEAGYKLLLKYSAYKTGFYKQRHQMYIDNRPHTVGMNRDTTPDSFGLLVNRVEYASTLESQGQNAMTKAYAKTYYALRRKYGKDWSIVYFFVNPDKIQPPGHFRKPSRMWARSTYTLPAIEIAPLNALPFYPRALVKQRRTIMARANSRRLNNPVARAIRARRNRNRR